MKFKIDTKEIFHVISIEEPELSANMADELQSIVAQTQEKNRKSLILKLEQAKSIEQHFAETILTLSHQTKPENLSFVVCCISEPVKKTLEGMGMLEELNLAPTESEAWDIVQMEEIERELGEEF
jgi:anti-anti-sigma factor